MKARRSGPVATRGDLRILRRVFAEIRGYRRWIVIIFLLDLLATPLALLTPVALAIAVDSGLSGRPLPSIVDSMVPGEASTRSILIVAGVIQVAVVLLTELRGLVASYVKSWVGERMNLDVRARMLAHAQQLSFRFHDRAGTADSIYRIQYDAPAIQTLGISGFIPMVTASVTLASMLFVVWRIDPPLALVALSITPLLVIVTRAFRSRMKRQYREVKRLESGALRVVQEVFSAFRVVKAFGMEKEEEQRFSEQSQMSAKARLRVSLAEGVHSMVLNGITAVGTSLVILFGGLAVADGRITLGALLLVLAYLGQLYGPLQTLTKQSVKLQSQLVSAERAIELLEEKPEVVDDPHGVSLQRARGTFDLLGVGFGYDEGQLVLSDVDLYVPAGAKVGIIGRTGAGKSTLVSLLIRFYDPTSGVILMDGIDLRKYRLADLRQQFTMVLQDPFLFSTTLRENIAFGRPTAPMSDIEAAAEAAGVHEFIAALPDGYDTLVGERGMRLSGGERQRISLARAFLKDAPILLLDEPTSSVDDKTEAGIMSAMERLMANRTTFMIAHRLTTLASCDLLVRVEDGRVRLLPEEQRRRLVRNASPPADGRVADAS